MRRVEEEDARTAMGGTRLWQWVAAPFRLDQRAIVLCRIVLGFYALLDLNLRLLMSGGIHWYTSSELDPAAVVAVQDTPHGAWVHKVLFYRGSVLFQSCIFGAHVLVASLFMLGWYTRITSVLLWLATVCMHGRQEGFHDGSDKYFRNLLLWCCFMHLQLRPPRSINHDNNSSSSSSSSSGRSAPLRSGDSRPAFSRAVNKEDRVQTQLSIGTIGYVLQVCLMYMGVIVLRFRDGQAWLDGTAVGYALGASFATRPPANYLIEYPRLCAALSYGGMVGEAIIPLLILATNHRSTLLRLATITNVAAVHAGIFAMFYLPQWSLLAASATLILLPTRALDVMERYTPVIGASVATESTNNSGRDGGGRRNSGGKRSADDAPSAASGTSEQREGGEGRRVCGSHKQASRDILSRLGSVLGCLLLAYMCHEWLSTDAGVITSFDNGDIGQSLRFYQGWVMFSNPSGFGKWYTVHATVPAVLVHASSSSSSTSSLSATANVMLDVDVLASLKERRVVLTTDDVMEEKRTSIPNCTSCLYPSWRYERFLHKVQERPHQHMRRHAIWPLSRHWCHMLQAIGDKQAQQGSLEFPNGTRVEHVYWGDMGLRTSVNLYRVLPPSAGHNAFRRFNWMTDIDVTIKCFTWPEFNDTA